MKHEAMAMVVIVHDDGNPKPLNPKPVILGLFEEPGPGSEIQVGYCLHPETINIGIILKSLSLSVYIYLYVYYIYMYVYTYT